MPVGQDERAADDSDDLRDSFTRVKGSLKGLIRCLGYGLDGAILVVLMLRHRARSHMTVARSARQSYASRGTHVASVVTGVVVPVATPGASARASATDPR